MRTINQSRGDSNKRKSETSKVSLTGLLKNPKVKDDTNNQAKHESIKTPDPKLITH